MADLKLISKNDGCDLELKGVDLVGIDGFSNMPLLGLFGGNVEESTKTFNDDELRFDWWGNDTFDFNNLTLQMNSKFEKSLNLVALNSSGRLELEAIAKKDLEFMNAFAKVELNLSIIGVDRIRLYLKITEPNNAESNEFSYIWDATENELIEE